MTLEEKMLATALRGLCGAHEGMVFLDPNGLRSALSEADAQAVNAALSTGRCSMLPALNSPANWGHWISSIHHKTGELEIELTADCHVVCSYDMATAYGHESLPVALMESFCAHMDNMVKLGLEESRPPSVLAWWKEHGQ